MIKFNFITFIFLSLAHLLITKINAQDLPKTQRVYPFSDSTSWVEIKTFKDLSDDLPNVEISKVNQKGEIVVDSVISMFSMTDLKDMNADQVEDLLISCTSGARANITYHLYLIDPLNNELIKVNNFHKVVNPELHDSLNVITELRLTAQNCYNFHRVTNNQLISLDTTICKTPDSNLLNNSTIEYMSEQLSRREKALNKN